MNMYLVQTVSSRPRPWSSYTNISFKEVRSPVRMNSAEEISKYNHHNSHYCSPVLARRTGGTSYDFPEKSPKKDKKWSLGSLFRRKKKNDSESSSEDEAPSKHFLQKKKKKADKRKRTNKAIGFDHVVVPPSSRHTLSNGYKSHEDSVGILSEPSFASRTMSKNFIPASDFTSRLVPLKDSQESLDRNGLKGSNNSLGSPSVSSLGRRKKETVKARAEARRDTSKGEESSDEDSQKSAFKSDESLTKQSRRSRGARTQRYLKRRSKDDELKDPLRACKSDIEHDHARNVQHLRLADERIQNMKSASKSPILSTTPKSKLCYTNSAPSSRPNFSGLSTIPPSHSSHSKYRTISLTNGSTYKQSSSFHDYNDTGNKCASVDLDNHRSLSCDANIHNDAPSPENVDEIVHVQFPLGKPFSKRPNMIISQHINPGKRHPPPPPPRDPRRIVSVQNSDGRPISYSFETGYKPKNGSDQQLNKPQPIQEANPNHNLNPNCRSTSEDHISWEPSQRVPLVPRPSSATPEVNNLQKIGRTYSENEENANSYRYLTDKNPRSRKPICIQSCTNQNDNIQSRVQVNGDQQNRSQKTFDFWRQKDEEMSRWNSRKSTPGSPLMFTAQTHVTTNIFLPSGHKIENDTPVSNPSDILQREASPFRPITPIKSPSPPKLDQIGKMQNGSVDEVDFIHRKSSNLEDALDELEAIYNSLHLGDEDLLDRAEKREAAAAQKRKDAAFESFPNSVSRGALSDSSFGYDPSFDSTRRKRFLKRSEPDRKADDMAFRKLNKDRYNTISDPQSVVSKVSYLLTSPVFNKPVEEPVPHNVKSKNKEPDVTLDDVVYRNVMHTNNSLKIVDPQLPFGIPVGPILPAANSDYLHATPEATQRFTFKPKKIPDVVKDDLAYRNLRKDANKEPALPQVNFSPEDYINNNSKSGETFKKKRAVRSLSANIFNLMHKDWKPSIVPVNNCESKQNITDVADALEIARQILKDKEDKINATRKAFMSDGELKYRKFGSSSPTEHRLNFLNDIKTSGLSNNENVYHHKVQVNIPIMDYDRLDAKPPTPDRRGSKPSTKESTPIPTSPSEDAQIKKQLQQSTLDELLTSLAVEAREASERITNELKLIGEEKERKRSLTDSSPLKDKLANGSLEKDSSSSQDRSINLDQENHESINLASTEKKLKELEEDAISCSLSLQLSEGDSTSEHAKLCEKLMECVVESTELLAATEVESEPSEEVARIKVEPLLPETVANIVLIPSDKSKVDVNPVSTEVFSESDHDYVNIQSTDETEKDVETEAEFPKSIDGINDMEKDSLIVEVPTDSLIDLGSSTEIDEEEKELLLLDDDSVSLDICMSPLEKHKAELVAAFQELNKNGTLKKTKIKQNGEGASQDVKSIEQTDKGGGEECFSVEYIALPTKGCAFVNESRFDFDDLYRKETERHLNVHNFDFNLIEGENGLFDDSCRNDEHLANVKFVENNVVDGLNCEEDLSKNLKFWHNDDRNDENLSRVDYSKNSEFLSYDANLVDNVDDLKCEDGKENLTNSLEFWHHDGDTLDSLKSPKLVQNLNTNYKISSEVHDSLEVSRHDFEDSPNIAEGSYESVHTCNGFENSLNNSDCSDTFNKHLSGEISFDNILEENRNFIKLINCDSEPMFSISNLDNSTNTIDRNSCTKLDVVEKPEQKSDSSARTFPSSERPFKNIEQSAVSDLFDIDLRESFNKDTKCNISMGTVTNTSVLTSQNAENSKNGASNNLDFPLGSSSERTFKNIEQSAVSDLTDTDLREAFNKDTKSNMPMGNVTNTSLLTSQNAENSKNGASNNLDFPLGSGSRDSRHTLGEVQRSRTWYEDPAVIALACSFGIACTSQLPSFDIIAVLGLLFAIISLLVALIART